MTTDYKNTLLMPNTDFSMKADLANKEIEYHKYWNEINLYQQILKNNKQKPSFILHDGPPYANGSIHVGHALNKILKDIIVRQKSMLGFYSPFVAGWDTHGLPIEHKMLQIAKKNQNDFKVDELRKACAEYALSQVELQKEEFKKLSLLTDFSDIYVTLDKKMEANQLRLLKEMIKKGLIYKDFKPIYWSPSSQSALAEAEVEYADHISPSMYVAFKVIEGNEFILKDDYVVIWTTTPWTLIANSGVSVNSEFDYVLVSHDNKNYVVAQKLLPELVSLFKWDEYKILKTFKGDKLLNIKYQSPINKLIAPVVEGHHVTLESGTGLVHMAPLFGEDDFLIGKKHNLEMIMHVEDDGKLNHFAGEYENLFYEDANIKIGQYLVEQNLQLAFKKIKHSYPHDWRTHLPIIYRATPQWFVSLKPIKENILDSINKVQTFNEWSKRRLHLMLEARQSWTISRQRAWGVPITIFYDKHKQPVTNDEILDYVINLVEEHGTDIWYKSAVDDLLPEKYRNLGYTKENDIMDVWFDSGSTSIGLKPGGIEAPYDLYLEGSDQYRGWFNSSMINSVAWRNQSPYKQLLSHGFVLDGKGQKMSKSKGNVVKPLDVVSKYGADILRLWVANSEYTSDVTIDDKIMQQNIEIYRKLRNTFKFMLGAISDFEYEDIKLEGIHLLIANRLAKLKNKIIEDYNNYRFINIIKNINNFVIDLSSYYISISKDSLYADSKNNLERKQIQFNLYQITYTLMIALAPILPTTSEEIYKFFPQKNKKQSVHLENFFTEATFNEEMENQWKEFFELKDLVYKNIELAIQNQEIKRQNEAHVIIHSHSEFLKSLDLVKLLMVAKVSFGNEMTVTKLQDSEKCQRCWNHFEKSQMVKDVCLRCQSVLDEKH
ncbi:isoleucine--tRNA ligase [Mycoplasma miroungirhinis]|uniref:Isoleucine--tRNA ligase n=1 Tax=Mycoplasma miroungirhinis TaxID=754516 RepID=A0A6M4JGF4_9MOLU|nr:isoleucine--tRNA ligase [Mycoplasma miroungirhinis]QJR44122.1 isoleucine--tRNA ligase [Mycoplasma miroungirhinis]